MNNLQIQRLLKNHKETRDIFQGVYAKDTLPPHPISTKPSAYICNTDPISKSGMHWVCFYFPPSGKAEYFDSYGFPPHKIFRKFLGGKRKYTYNKCFIQHPMTTTCGQYCMYYILRRSQGESKQEILKFFCDKNSTKISYINNDLLVVKTIEKEFHFKSKIFCVKTIKKQFCRYFEDNQKYFRKWAKECKQSPSK